MSNIFNKKIFKGKKGLTWSFLVKGLIALLILIVIASLGINKIGGLLTDTGGKVDHFFADCDKDNIDNKFDNCPCIPKGQNAAKDLKLLGCPEGTALSKAEEDQRTCFEPSDDNVGDDKTTNCDGVHAASEYDENTEEATDARKVNSDLVIKEFKVDGKDKGPLLFDLKKEQAYQQVTVESTIENIGPSSLTDFYDVKYFVCKDEAGKICIEKQLYSELTATTQAKAPKPTIDPIDAPVISPTGQSINLPNTLPVNTPVLIPKNWIRLGDGDYCSSNKEITTCYVKVMVDSEKKLTEPREDNNQKIIPIRIKDIKAYDGWNKAQILLGTNFPEGVFQADCFLPFAQCGTFFKTKMANKIGKSTWSGSGDYPLSVPDSGCFVYSADKSSIGSSFDLGYGAVKNGAMLEFAIFSKLELIPNTFIGKSDAKDAFDESWKSSSDGSLICNDGFWYLCKKSENNQKLYINEKEFTCKNRFWK